EAGSRAVIDQTEDRGRLPVAVRQVAEVQRPDAIARHRPRPPLLDLGAFAKDLELVCADDLGDPSLADRFAPPGLPQRVESRRDGSDARSGHQRLQPDHLSDYPRGFARERRAEPGGAIATS